MFILLYAFFLSYLIRLIPFIHMKTPIGHIEMTDHVIHSSTLHNLGSSLDLFLPSFFHVFSSSLRAICILILSQPLPPPIL